jgi:NADPH:quinone reductase-like Zn-dependent oxidoreductase
MEIVDLPEPEPGPGEVRIRVHAAAVNPADITFRAGGRAAQLAGRPAPFIPGMDAAGVIDKLGDDTDGRLAVGDRVIAYVIPFGPHGGAYAEKIVVPAASTVRAPRGVPFSEASTLLLNATTARLSLDALALPPGATVAVTGGAGAVGGYVIQLAKADGLTVLTDAAGPDEALVRSLGADLVVDRHDDLAVQVHRVLPDGAAGLIDGAALDDRALPAIADGGSLATLKGWNGPSERGIVIHPISSFGSATSTALFDQLVRQAEAGVLTLRVRQVLPAAKAAEAHRRLGTGGVRGRLVLDFARPL